MNSQELKQLLEKLEITEDISELSIREINAAFRKQVKKSHPDKVGLEKTAECQDLIAAYKKLKDYFKEKDNLKEEDIYENDDEEQFFRDNFQRFNFPCENNGSFTVEIEDSLADTWQECLKTLLGEPKVKINDKGTECDRNWKYMYGDVELTIHIYNKPKNKKVSKILIQGRSQSAICSYVFEELPRIYKDVCANKPKIIESNRIRNKLELSSAKLSSLS